MEESAGDGMTDHHINNSRTAAVSDVCFWQPMATCPLALKVLLLGQGGIASIGQYNGKEAFWQGWAALPQRKPS